MNQLAAIAYPGLATAAHSSLRQYGPGLLGALLRIRRGVTGVGGQLALVVDGPPMSELVATSLLARLVHVTADRESALVLVRATNR